MTLGIFFREYILVFGARGKKRIQQSKGREERVHSKAGKQKTSIFILPETRSYRKGIQGMVPGLPASVPPENRLQTG